MKKIVILISTILILAFVTSQVFASPAIAIVADKKTTTSEKELKPPQAGTPEVKSTPGLKAIEKAQEKATEKPGKDEKAGKKENFQGIVQAVSADTLTILVKDDTIVIVKVNQDTQVKVPSLKTASLADIKAGARLTIQATRDSSNTLVARFIHLIPGQPARIHRVGTVTAYTPGASITIQAKDGNKTTFQVTAQTKILPEELKDQIKVGALVTIISPRQVSSGLLAAQGIVIHTPDEVD